MDAVEDNRDIVLYRASSDLLPAIARQLDDLVGDVSERESPNEQRWVSDSKTSKLTAVLELFQEWPQLLDPLLPDLVSPLARVILEELAADYHDIRFKPQTSRRGMLPSSRAACRILNTLCKVRGVKVITRFLGNEPQYLEPMLRHVLCNQSHMIWQELYVTLLWLSHLILTPFDLQSISISNPDSLKQARVPSLLDPQDLPLIASAAISVGLRYVTDAGKQRESATLLLVRLSLRPDMQRLGMLDRLTKLTFSELQGYTQTPAASTYKCLGYLSFLSGFLKAGSDKDVLPFLQGIFKFCHAAATSLSAECDMIRKTAPCRKMLVTILRMISLHALSIDSRNGVDPSPDDAMHMTLEETIQYLLDALGDKDTPVRLAASKALSMICERLRPQMKAEVVQAVLESLEEDVFYTKLSSREIESATIMSHEHQEKVYRNLTAVDSLRWQGLMWTLAHLLFRRTAGAAQLPLMLKSLLVGLDFEQRSAIGTSVGGPVRDAACLGCWSLARKYSTSDLRSIESEGDLPEFKIPFHGFSGSSVLQTIATNLVVSACLDPSGNIRRGSSAALQELVGRHPDNVVEGIALVQIVDYHAVARRSRAVLSVALGAAELSGVYKGALLDALFGWRGVRSVDDDARRTAAAAVSRLASLGSISSRWEVLEATYACMGDLPQKSSRMVVESQHGLLMTLSCLLETLDTTIIAELKSTTGFPVESLLEALWKDVRIDGQLIANFRVKDIPELLLEGLASLISSLSLLESEGESRLTEQATEVLDVCLLRAENEVTLVADVKAALGFVGKLQLKQKCILVSRWLDPKLWRHPSFSCKGRVLALGAIYQTLPTGGPFEEEDSGEGCRSKICAQLTDFVEGDWPIETQVRALQSLAYTVGHLEELSLWGPICAGLDNYKNDQRGDIGSLARWEAVQLVGLLIQEMAKKGNRMSNQRISHPVLQRVFRLAGEKLDKLRFAAWACIERYLNLLQIRSTQQFTHVVDVSTERYFLTLLQFLQIDWLQPSVLQGLVHSMTSGTEVLTRVSRLALVDHASNHYHNNGSPQILETLLILLDNSYANDRQAVPLLEAIAFVLEQQSQPENRDDRKLPILRLWNVVRKAHFKSTNIRKLEAAVAIYAALAGQSEMRERTLGKLCDLLPHPYPSIRNAAAAALYVELPSETLMRQDWSSSVAELRNAVQSVRAEVTVLVQSAC